MKPLLLLHRTLLIAMLALAPMMITSGCGEQDAGESVVKTTRLDESRQDSLKKQKNSQSSKSSKNKPKIQSFGKHEPVDI